MRVDQSGWEEWLGREHCGHYNSSLCKYSDHKNSKEIKTVSLSRTNVCLMSCSNCQPCRFAAGMSSLHTTPHQCHTLLHPPHQYHTTPHHTTPHHTNTTYTRSEHVRPNNGWGARSAEGERGESSRAASGQTSWRGAGRDVDINCRLARDWDPAGPGCAIRSGLAPSVTKHKSNLNSLMIFSPWRLHTLQLFWPDYAQFYID